MTEKENSAKEFERLLLLWTNSGLHVPGIKTNLESLRKLTIEETYELAEAIYLGNDEKIKKELGDLMLHLVFYARIGSERGSFSILDVLTGINEKLIYRHPHVFGDVKVSGASEVEENWEQLKTKEDNGYKPLSGVPSSLPAAIKANSSGESQRCRLRLGRS